MFGGQGKFSASSLRHAVTRTLLLLFVLRALIPAGYMPSTQALGEGHIEVVLCTSNGLRTIVLDADGKPAEPANHHPDAASDCPFGAVTTKAFLAPDSEFNAAEPARAESFVFNLHDLALQPPAQGPPLGSRAPPVILG